MGQEIRCLPNHHDAKLKMLEVITDQLLYAYRTYHLEQKEPYKFLSSVMQVGKISLYAASSAVREIQKITLDPK
jgi:lysine-specific demethylase 3